MLATMTFPRIQSDFTTLFEGLFDSSNLPSVFPGTIKQRAAIRARYTDAGIEYELDVPGFKHDLVKVTCDDDTIRVFAQRKGHDIDVRFRVHRGFDSKRAQATVVDGLLTIAVPKATGNLTGNIPVTPG